MILIIFLAGTANLVMAIFSLFKIPNFNFLKKYFLSFTVSTSLWLFSNVLLSMHHNQVWFCLAYALGTLVISNALIMIDSFALQTKLPLRRYLFFQILGLIFLILCFNERFFFIFDFPEKNSVSYTSSFYLYLLYFILAIGYSIIKLLLCIKNFRGIKKVQAKLIFSGILGFGVFAFLVSFLLPAFGIYDFMLLDTCGAFIFISLTAYAIIRYHAMDIYVIVKQSTLYGLMVFIITAIYIGTTFLFENIVAQLFGYPDSFITRIISAIFISVIFLPLRNLIEKNIDKLFFRERLNLADSIQKFNQKLITVLDLRELINIIINNVKDIVKTKSLALLIYDEKNKKYHVKAFKGLNRLAREFKLTDTTHLIQMLKIEKRIVTKSELIDKKVKPVSILKQMEIFNAELLIPLYFGNKMLGLLILGEKKSEQIYTQDEINFLRTMSNEAAIAFANAITYSDLKNTYLGTIEAFAAAIEAKDKYTRGHSDRVSHLATFLAIQLGMDRDEIEKLKYAAILHDIGKIGVDDKVLNKSSPLSSNEFEIIRQHPVIGKYIIYSIKFLEDVQPIILHHHERWDGTGYPAGLKAEEIPLPSRILTIADAFDAIVSNRSYRPAKNIEEAVAIIQENSGSQFDPNIVSIFLQNYLNCNLDDILLHFNLTNPPLCTSAHRRVLKN